MRCSAKLTTPTRSPASVRRSCSTMRTQMHTRTWASPCDESSQASFSHSHHLLSEISDSTWYSHQVAKAVFIEPRFHGFLLCFWKSRRLTVHPLKLCAGMVYSQYAECFVSIHAELLRVLLRRGEPAAAVAAHRSALAADPNHTAAYGHLALAYAAVGSGRILNVESGSSIVK